MLKLPSKFKWPLLVLINVFPFLLNVLFYTNGFMDDLFLFLPILAGLTVLNYLNCTKVVHFVLLQVFMLVCLICSGYAATYLHYHNIVEEVLTLIVGQLFVLLEAATNIIVTLVTAILKHVRNKKHEQGTRS